jgi:hypothetical protein
VLWFAEVILHPALSTYHHHAGQTSAFWFGLMFASLMVVAISTWAFFKVREIRMRGLEEEPEYG